MGKAHIYTPTLGRFTQPDTLISSADNPQAWNRFSYVMNSPILYNDPSGHMRANENGSDGKKGCADRDYCEEAQKKSDEEREARKNRGAKKVDALPYSEECGREDVGCKIYTVEGGSLYALHYYHDVDSVFVPTGEERPAVLQDFIDTANARSTAAQNQSNSWSGFLTGAAEAIVSAGGVAGTIIEAPFLAGLAFAGVVDGVRNMIKSQKDLKTAKDAFLSTEADLPEKWDAVKELP